jgi:hypothetical protein
MMNDDMALVREYAASQSERAIAQFSGPQKAPEDWRTPGRFALFHAPSKFARASWSAVVLYRFGHKA